MASGIYNSYKTTVLSPTGVDYLADNIRVALIAPGYTPDFAAEAFFSDVQANEASGAGYTAGGELLTTKTVDQDDADNRGVFDADDVQWPGSTIAARGALIYKDTGSAATSPLIGYIDFGTTRNSDGGTFTLQWQSVGIVLAS